MKEFIDKLIERLEEKAFIDYDEYYTDGGECLISISDVKEIVNELAEEYINCSTDISTKSSDCSTKVSEIPTGWIPCSERLPEEGATVLVQDFEDYYEVCNVESKDGISGFTSGDWWASANNYLAWKPLPAPYTEG